MKKSNFIFKISNFFKKQVSLSLILIVISAYSFNTQIVLANQSPLSDPNTPFVLAVEKDYPPFLFVEGDNVMGIAFEYTKLIAQKNE